MKLVLASTSKIRRHLLHNAGVKVILASPLVDEYRASSSKSDLGGFIHR